MLTEKDIRETVPSHKRFKLFDSRGLFLLIDPAGGKWWRFRYRFGGKDKSMAMGIYPDVTLKQARVLREEARQLIENEIDPAAVRREQKAREKADRLAAEGSASVKVSVSVEGAVEVWKGSGVVRLTRHQASVVRDLLSKLLA